MSRAFFESFCHGVVIEKPWAVATASRTRYQYSSREPAHGAIAPSSIDRSGSGITSSGSTSSRVPSPSQVGHAPYGELNEKLRGWSSSNDRPSNGQASFSLYVWMSSPCVGLHGDRDEALGQLERRLDRIGDPPPDVGLGDEPVDDDLDRVLVVLRQPDRLARGRWVSPSMRARTKPFFARSCSSFSYSPLRPWTTGASTWNRVPSGSSSDLVDDLLGRLAADRAAALRAVRMSDPRVQHPEVVVDLGDRPDGRAGVPGGRLLVDRDRRRETLDEVDVGLLHLPEELPCVRRQRLDVAALALGVERVEGERRLARSRTVP